MTHSLEENGIVTRCEITTFDSSEVYDLPYDDEERVQKLILNVRLDILSPTRSASLDGIVYSRRGYPKHCLRSTPPAIV